VAIQNAQIIAIGGGNTFNLLYELYKNELIDVIQKRVAQDMKYIGSKNSFVFKNGIKAKVKPNLLINELLLYSTVHKLMY